MRKVLLFYGLLLLDSFNFVKTRKPADKCSTVVHFDKTDPSIYNIYYDPKEYLYIPTLAGNKAKKHQILDITLYYRGKKDFDVLLTSTNDLSGDVFNTSKCSFL